MPGGYKTGFRVFEFTFALLVSASVSVSVLASTQFERDLNLDPSYRTRLTNKMFETAYGAVSGGEGNRSVRKQAPAANERPRAGAARSPSTSNDSFTLEPTDDDRCTYWPIPEKKLFSLKTFPGDICVGRKSELVVHSDSQMLILCKDGRSYGEYDVSLGRGGFGKTREGDEKTPTGTYELAAPRASNPNYSFGTFIGIEYPTPAQKRQGFTGSAVGVHGPHRKFRCAGFFNVLVNWTNGCVAVASDLLAKEVGKFVQSNDVKSITILPPAPARGADLDKK